MLGSLGGSVKWKTVVTFAIKVVHAKDRKMDLVTSPLQSIVQLVGCVMSWIRTWVSVGAVAFCCGLFAAHFVWDGRASAHSPANDRARIVLSKSLSKLDGDHLKVVLVEVTYGPGEGSLPHSHPCPVIGYVVEGALRTQVKGEAEMIYKAGESFYEAPNGVHLVSANASSTGPAKLVAYLICDRDTPLSLPAPDSKTEGGGK